MNRTILALSALATLAAPLAAQEVRIVRPRAGAITMLASGGDRAMLGVSTASGSKRDTLGVLISSLTEGGPAEKAGLGEGDRIQSINGVSLKVNRDDAGDDEIGGIMQRRLSRELGKVKAGDEVSLQVWTNGQSKTVKVKTIAAEELTRSRMKVSRSADERAVIGIGYGLTGSKRDTAGVFVNSVVADGPSEKAGIVEGDRIAAINGVSLKMSKDDIEDGWAGNSRMNRLSREMAKAKPGDAVELTVISGGRARTVKVTTVKASSLKESGSVFFYRSPEAPMPPMPPMPAMAPRAPSAPRAPAMHWRTFDDGDVDVQLEMSGVRSEIERALREEMPRMRIELRQGLEQARKELRGAQVKLRLNNTVRM
ncbi:MAG: PDZ domain-containing protein [Gemmatimonadaceae bacterium]